MQDCHELLPERTAAAWIPLYDFLILVGGQSAHGAVAGLEFDLNEDVVSGLRQFAAGMAPTGSAREIVSGREELFSAMDGRDA